MIRHLRAVLAAVALAVVAAVAPAADPAAASVAQPPPGGSSTVAEEAPSSLTTGDQVRAFAVLGVCLTAIVLPVVLVARSSRRRRLASFRSDPKPP